MHECVSNLQELRAKFYFIMLGSKLKVYFGMPEVIYPYSYLFPPIVPLLVIYNDGVSSVDADSEYKYFMESQISLLRFLANF